MCPVANYLPVETKTKKQGRKRIYGKKVSIQHWTYEDLEIKQLDKTFAVAHQIVRTKICPIPVRLVVIRTRPKPNKPYRYFLIYTTDLNLAVETIVYYYILRWTLETGFRDGKESFGFDHYQVRSQSAIQRSVVLSFVTASLTQLLALPQFQHQQDGLPELKVGLQEMNIHWYHPTRWTMGLIVRYIRWRKSRQFFSASFSQIENHSKFQKPFPDVAG